MAFSADAFAKGVLGMTADDKVFSASKLFFAYGLGNSMYFPFRVGAPTILYPDRPLPDAVFCTIIEQRPTVFFGVPTLYNNLLTHYKEHREDYPASMMSSGDPSFSLPSTTQAARTSPSGSGASISRP